MGTNLTFQYDREADILYINTCSPYPEQESEELDDEIIARFNPETGEIENLEVMFFSTRLLRKELFQLPISARLHLHENIQSAEGETV
ncbi:DUF2283 domain-containing protein [Candidatus Poribacteria bacterium]|nr:DUF2283 domain-containing protein [Candidatus Poribacteria bacterium]